MAIPPAAIITTITALILVIVPAIAIFLTSRIPRHGFNYVIPFLAFLSTILLFGTGLAFASVSPLPEIFDGRIWWAFLFFGLAPPLLYHFALLYVHPKPKGALRLSLIPTYAYFFFWIGLLVISPSWVFTGSALSPAGFMSGAGRVLFVAYHPAGMGVHLIIFSVGIIGLLTQHRKKHSSPQIRGQIRYVGLGLMLYIVGSLFAFSPFLGPLVMLMLLAPAGMVVMTVGLRKHQFFITPQSEIQAKEESLYLKTLKVGRFYRVEENAEVRPDKSLKIFSDLTTHGFQGLCISRVKPRIIREDYGLEKTPLRYLSEQKEKKTNGEETSSKEVISPTDLLALSLTIQEFLSTVPKPVILLHGLEYLVALNGFEPVYRTLINRLNEVDLRGEALILMSLVKGSIESLNEKRVEAETEVYRP